MAAPPQPLPLAEEETLLSSVEREALPVQRRRRAALAVSATAAAGLLAAAGLWAAGIGRSPSSHSAESTAVGLFAGPCASLGSAALADGTVAENPCKAPRYPASDDVHLGAPAGRSSALPETTPVLEASTPGSLPRHCYDDAGAPTQACALPGFSATVRDHFWKQAAQEVKATRFAEKESNVCATGNWGDSTQVNQWDQGFSPCWPSAMTISASWDTELVSRWSLELAREFGKPSRGQLGPGINLARFAWNGRLGEYMSGEDPFFGSRMVGSMVEAFRRVPQPALQVAKHFIPNTIENNRTWITEVVDERTLFEVYYPPFVAAVDGGVSAIMCSYNLVRCTTGLCSGKAAYACANDDILNKHLKQVMGFKGVVMSDWGATTCHKEAVGSGGCPEGSKYILRDFAARAGLDVEMPSCQTFKGGVTEAAGAKDKAMRMRWAYLVQGRSVDGTRTGKNRGWFPPGQTTRRRLSEDAPFCCWWPKQAGQDVCSLCSSIDAKTTQYSCERWRRPNH